jgi:hypothetical protein
MKNQALNKYEEIVEILVLNALLLRFIATIQEDRRFCETLVNSSAS